MHHLNTLMYKSVPCPLMHILCTCNTQIQYVNVGNSLCNGSTWRHVSSHGARCDARRPVLFARKTARLLQVSHSFLGKDINVTAHDQVAFIYSTLTPGQACRLLCIVPTTSNVLQHVSFILHLIVSSSEYLQISVHATAHGLF